MDKPTSKTENLESQMYRGSLKERRAKRLLHQLSLDLSLEDCEPQSLIVSDIQFADNDADTGAQPTSQHVYNPSLKSYVYDAPLPDHLVKSMKGSSQHVQCSDVMRDVILEDEEWTAVSPKSPPSSIPLNKEMVTDRLQRRKLSEARGVKFPLIDLTLPASPAKPCLTPGGRSCHKGKAKQVTYADQVESSSNNSTISQLTPSIIESPTDYFPRHPDLTVNTLLRCNQPSLSSAQWRGYEQINVTVYRADMKGYKFSFHPDQKKTAKDMLNQLASHFGIEPNLFRSCCAIWIVSDLLELQLRDSHEPWEMRKKWPKLLKQYACADEAEINKDEPLLFLKRNVHLGLEKEKLVENKNNEALTEILYYAARDEVISGRYACDIKTSVRLAGLQMAIELSDFDGKQQSLKSICFEIPDFFPVQHRHAVKSFYLFGIPLMGRKSLEYETFQAYESALSSETYPNNHERRKAYLQVVRETPLYGAAFFHGLVERRPAESVMDIKKMILSATLPSVEVLVAVNRNYCAVLSANQLELLFITPLSVCELGRIDASEPSNGKTNAVAMEDLPVLYLSVENDSSFINQDPSTVNEDSVAPSQYTLLPVYTRQVKLVQFLHETLSKLENKKPTQNFSSEERLSSIGFCSSPSSSIRDTESNSPVGSTKKMIETTDSRYSYANSQCESSDQRSPPQTPLPCLPCHMNKMCVAKFDTSLKCLVAQGSLKKILREMMSV